MSAIPAQHGDASIIACLAAGQLSLVRDLSPWRRMTSLPLTGIVRSSTLRPLPSFVRKCHADLGPVSLFSPRAVVVVFYHKNIVSIGRANA
jgi:hypothetical protein